jgi:hypothetical protein
MTINECHLLNAIKPINDESKYYGATNTQVYLLEKCIIVDRSKPTNDKEMMNSSILACEKLIGCERKPRMN